MNRLLLTAAILLITAPAYAGFFQSTFTDPVTGEVFVTGQVSTPDFVYTPPAKPIFSTTTETRRKNNGDRVRVTTTFRNGEVWTKEKAVVHSGRQGGKNSGGGGKGKSSGR